MRVHTHAWLKCHVKGVCTCVTSLNLAYSLVMIHTSLLFQQGHFETNPNYDLTDSDIHKFLPCFPVLEAQGISPSAPESGSLATWPNQMQTHLREQQAHALDIVFNLFHHPKKM